MYTPITIQQTLDNNRVHWYSRPTKNQLLNILKSGRYQNIVLVGHGTKNSYTASDQIIRASDINPENISKLPGYLIQYTCGGTEDPGLGDILLTNPDKAYVAKKNLTARQNYLKAWRNVFYDL